MDDRPETPPLSPLMLLGLVAGPVLSMVDSAVVNVAVPEIARDLGGDLPTVQWTISGYLLAMAAGLAASAYLGRRFGLLRAYSWVLAAFTLASALCALAPGVQALIAARALQGLVAAPMVPLAVGMLLGRGTGKMPVTGGLIFFTAPAIGPALGGLLISAYGWRSAFLVNVPLGLVALVGAVRAARSAGAPGDHGARLDVPGLMVLAPGLALTAYGTSEAAQRGWPSTAAWWATGVALLAVYVVWARRERPVRPVVDLGLLADSRRALAVALAGAASVVLFAVLFLVPVFLREVQNASTTLTGLVLLPQGLVMGLGVALGNRTAERFPIRGIVASGMTVLAASTGLLLLLDATTPSWVTALLLCGRGLALGFTVQPLTIMLLSGLPDDRVADANTLYSISQRLAGSVGIALLATFYSSHAITGSPVDALHASGLLLSAVAGVGALAALALRHTPVPRSEGVVERA